MYRQDDPHQMKFEEFYLPVGGKLRRDNRWVILSQQIPGQQIEPRYTATCSGRDTGNVAKSARVALGALIIKERLGLTDRETVLQIQENPYLQAFLGFPEYSDEAPFDHSLTRSIGHARTGVSARSMAFGYRDRPWADRSRSPNPARQNWPKLAVKNGGTNGTGMPLRASSAKANVGSPWTVSWPSWPKPLKR